MFHQDDGSQRTLIVTRQMLRELVWEILINASTLKSEADIKLLPVPVYDDFSDKKFVQEKLVKIVSLIFLAIETKVSMKVPS